MVRVRLTVSSIVESLYPRFLTHSYSHNPTVIIEVVQLSVSSLVLLEAALTLLLYMFLGRLSLDMLVYGHTAAARNLQVKHCTCI